MSKNLIAYFSASGVTKRVAEKLASVADADIFEIKPTVPYSDADLNWNDKNSRSSVEMSNKAFRPEVAQKLENMEQYDTIFVGFPVWWYVAPTIINTFLESYDFSGKNIALFATSGGSGLGNSQKELEPCVDGSVKWLEGKRFSSSVSEKELEKWLKSLEI